MKNIICLLLVLFASKLDAQGDPCSDLKTAFYNQTQISNSGNFVSDFSNWFSAAHLREFINKNRSGIGITIPIDGISIGFDANTNDETYSHLQEAINTRSHQFFNQSFANNFSTQIVNDNSVDKYIECLFVTNGTLGLQRAYKENGMDFTIALRFQGGNNLPVNKCTITKINFSGATYDTALLKEGTIIGTGGISVSCKRIGTGPVTITINSDLGPAAPILLKGLSAPKSNFQRCLEGSSSACLLYKEELEQKYGAHPTLEQQREMEYWVNKTMIIEQLKAAKLAFGEDSPQYLQTKFQLELISDIYKIDQNGHVILPRRTF